MPDTKFPDSIRSPDKPWDTALLGPISVLEKHDILVLRLDRLPDKIIVNGEVYTR